MLYPLLKMQENRVRRNYAGGKIIDEIRKVSNPQDGNRPEEWIFSLVEAVNPGLPIIQNEGFSTVEGGSDFKTIISENPEFYLGNSNLDTLGFLAKWIDSSIRLHVQVHPTRDFSKKYLNRPYGKFECYYILSTRSSVQPYIRLGFQNPPASKEEWKTIIESQDIAKMDACFTPIPVKQGDVVFIPGGVPHAIGEGILLLEVMEPSDLVVRCEFNREGIIVPPDARFLGKSLDFCLDIFDYSKMDVQTIKDKFFISPKLISDSEQLTHHQLINTQTTNCFEIQRLQIHSESHFTTDKRYSVAVCISGNSNVSCQGQLISLGPLDSFFIAFGEKELTITPTGEDPVEICLILPSEN